MVLEPDDTEIRATYTIRRGGPIIGQRADVAGDFFCNTDFERVMRRMRPLWSSTPFFRAPKHF
jgi:hypothetical protein